MNLIYFLGRLHVLALHVPIGIVLVAVLFDAVARRDRYPKTAGDYLWGAAAVAASITVILGYMHLAEGGFAAASATAHRNYGTALALIVAGLWAIRRYRYSIYRKIWMFTGLLVLFVVTMTGHYGGNLTHGSSFLSELAPRPVRWLAGLEPRRTALTGAPETRAHSHVENLLRAGFVARRVSEDDGGLIVSIDAPGGEITPAQLSVLTAASEHVVELGLPRAGLRDGDLQGLANFTSLTALRLDQNRITDSGVKLLALLPKLEVLNVYGNTGITDASIDALARMRELRVLYVWNTGISPAAISSLGALRPDLTVVGALADDLFLEPADSAAD